jgi:hypothetical protein
MACRTLSRSPHSPCLRMPAGELTVQGISGDKDVASFTSATLASQWGTPLTMQVWTPRSLPVTSRRALSRISWRLVPLEKHGSGRYKLHGHVGAGDLMLR